MQDFPFEKLTPAFPGDLRIDNDDQLTAGSGQDTFYGQGGNDLIAANGGNDYANGGSGPDNLAGGPGNDRLYGGDGNDVIGGDAGDDLLAGNAGNDKLYGRFGNDVLIGGLGADQMNGNEGNDLMYDGIVFEGAVPPPPQPTSIASDDSRFVNDNSDALMAALLADWALDSMLNAASMALMHPHDTSIDLLSGDTGTDLASPGPLDTGNWESTF